MNKEFNELSGMYQNAVKANDVAKQNEILQAMRDYFKNKGYNVSENTSYEKMIKLHGQLNNERGEQIRNEKNDIVREALLGKMKHKPNIEFLSLKKQYDETEDKNSVIEKMKGNLIHRNGDKDEYCFVKSDIGRIVSISQCNYFNLILIDGDMC